MVSSNPGSPVRATGRFSWHAGRTPARAREHVPFRRNRDVLSIQALAHVLIGEPVSIPDQVRDRLSPGYALGVAAERRVL
jgi:hypothetical protein